MSDLASTCHNTQLYNEQLYLLYKTDQLTQVLPEDMSNLQLILSVAYLIAGVG